MLLALSLLCLSPFNRDSLIDYMVLTPSLQPLLLCCDPEVELLAHSSAHRHCAVWQQLKLEVLSPFLVLPWVGEVGAMGRGITTCSKHCCCVNALKAKP